MRVLNSLGFERLFNKQAGIRGVTELGYQLVKA
jgi:hypothetical protein